MPAKKQNTATSKNESVPPVPDVPQVTAVEDEGDGVINISENVIASVVRKYTLEIDGVIRFSAGGLVSGLADLIGRRSSEGSSINVNFADDGSVQISVTLVLRFGVRVAEVAGLVREVIRSRVEDLTGKHVSKVNVMVADLEEQEPELTLEEEEE